MPKFEKGNTHGAHRGREKGSKNKKTLARLATMKRALEQGIEPIIKPGPKDTLNPDDLAIVIKLLESGKTQTEVAEQFGVNQTTISRAIAQFGDSRELAKRKLHANAVSLTDIALAASRIAGEMGNAEPALELLDRMEVAPKRAAQDAAGGPRVIVVVGQASPSALPSARVLEHPRQS